MPSVETVSDLDTIEREWRLLGERSDNVFASWEWLSTWWRHYGRGRPLLCSVQRSADGSPLSILPLYVSTRRPVRVLRLLGHGPTDELGPICAPGDRAVAAAALRERLDTLEWDLAIVEQMNSALEWNDILGGRRLPRTASPIVRFDGLDWSQFLATRSRNLREQVRRKTRRLADLGRVTFRFTDDPDRLDADFTTLIALHDARWEGKSRCFLGEREPFYRDFAAQALRRGWLRLWFCELDGRPVAALWNMRFGACESMYQAGRDPALAHASVGLVLQGHVLQRAIEDGLTEYRFLRGDEPYKSRFANDDPGLETVGIARGSRARALLRVLGPVPNLPRHVRRCFPASLAWGVGSVPYWGKE